MSLAKNKISGNTLRGPNWYWLRLSNTVNAKYMRLIVQKTVNKYAGFAEINFYNNNREKIDKTRIEAISNRGGAPNVHVINHTIDNSLDTLWSPYSMASASSLNIAMYNFKSKKDISAFSIYTMSDNWSGVGSNTYLEDFIIQFSNDDSVSITDELNSPKWGGVDLINGDFNNSNLWGGQIIEGTKRELFPLVKSIIKTQNSFNTIHENILVYPNIQEPLTIKDYNKYGSDGLDVYGSNINKVQYEMYEGGILEDGRIIRRTINKNDFKINSLEIT